MVRDPNSKLQRGAILLAARVVRRFLGKKSTRIVFTTLITICFIATAYFISNKHNSVLEGLYSGSAKLSRAIRCTQAIDINLFSNASHSLNAEESMLFMKYFKNVCNGSYVEIGAHDGIGQSNTWAFNKSLN